jgi:riboflavin kinase/FMN adenylyltransferase
VREAAVRVIRGISEVRIRGRSAVTVGSFDGVHLGHRRILDEIVLLAKGLGVTGVVVTFDPHPMAVLHSKQAPCLLTTTQEKVELIDEIGVDQIVILRFTAKIARKSAEWFVRNLLLERLNMRRLVIGYDFKFGKGREGDAAYLEGLGEDLGFGVDIVPPVSYRGHPISSTRVRTALVRGDISSAAKMMGRPYALTGVVVKGEGRGRILDFPTANLKVAEPRKMLPADGVYAVMVRMGRDRWPGALYVGTKPTFGGAVRGAEVHIMGSVGDLYGRKARVSFAARIRDDARFDDEGTLRRAIGRDIARARRILST